MFHEQRVAKYVDVAIMNVERGVQLGSNLIAFTNRMSENKVALPVLTQPNLGYLVCHQNSEES